MSNYILECCVDSVESAIIAQQGGAARIELCSNLIIGGTTPSFGFFREVKRNVQLPIHVLLRPRFGDFLYSDKEFSILCQDVELFREEGADCIVIGCLKKDGSLDCEKMKELIHLAGPMSVTLHRAFDLCKDPFFCMKQAIELGINTILTSGQKQSCLEGKDLLQKLCEKAGSDIDIMAGAGIDKKSVALLLEETNIHSFHMSGKKILKSEMEYRKSDVTMGLGSISEYDIWQTDIESIKEVKNLLNY